MKYYDPSKVTATLGDFSAQVGPVRGYLFLKQNGEQVIVAETVYPEWSDTHETIEKWIKKVTKQKHNRRDKIDCQLDELRAEQAEVEKFILAANTVI